LFGNAAPAGTNGLVIEAGNSTMRGLLIKGFTGIGDPNTSSPSGGVAIAIRTNGGNRIEGNFLGGTTFDQTTVDPNSHGVQIGDSNGNGAPNNIIGGTAPAARNLISGNTYAGIAVLSASSSSNQIQGNYIGTDRDGARRTLNRFGIILSAPNNTIGGTVDGARNVISANFIDGINITAGGNSNTILGNYIGTDATGTIKTEELGNGFSGIMISGASDNIIGGTGAGTRNVISGNNLEEIYIDGSPTPATGNKIEGNYIGTDKTGTVALASSPYGVLISDSSSNFIGGTAPGAGNVISGHTTTSVLIEGVGAFDNLVQGNLIGTDVTGTKRFGGSANGGGVLLSFTRNNTIGGSAPGARNLISGNDGSGVFIESLEPAHITFGNKIQGNYIGTDITGTLPLPNGFGGVVFYGGADNTIGGTGAGEGNLISGNIGPGIAFHDADLADTRDNKVQGNLIGTDITGAFDLGNTEAGVLIEDSYRNTIGGTNDDAGNAISGNDGPGIFVTGATAEDNQISQNLIGRNAANDGPLGNAGHGILLQSSGPNVIGGGFDPNNANTIAHNGGDGVAVVFGTGPCA